jgi:hypothetical protein
MDKYSTLEIVEKSLDLIENHKNGLFEKFTTKQIEEYIYKSISIDDFTVRKENLKLKFIHYQQITWCAYMIYRMDSEKEKLLIEIDQDQHKTIKNFGEFSIIDNDNEDYILNNVIDTPILFYSLSELMALFEQFKNGKITKNIDEFFQLIQDKIALLIKHTYDTHVIDMNEYEKSTLDNLYHVNTEWTMDVFCLCCDIYKLHKFGEQLNKIPTKEYTIDKERLQEYQLLINERYNLINKYEFTDKCDLYTIKSKIMLFERFKTCRSNNKQYVKENDIIKFINPDYTPIEVVDIYKAEYNSECFQTNLFNQSFRNSSIEEYYSIDYEITNMLNRTFNPLDVFKNYQFFIARAPPQVSYKFVVIDRKNNDKYICLTFSEAMYLFTLKTEFKLF